MNKIINQSSHLFKLFQLFLAVCFLFFSNQAWAAGDFSAPNDCV